MLKHLHQLLTSKELGAVLGLLGLATGIYFGIFYQPQPSIVLELVDDSRVVEILEGIPDLSVHYKGNPLASQQVDIRQTTLRLKNDGRGSVRLGDYDVRAPVGFELLDGRIIDVKVVHASNDYLRENLQVRQEGKSIRFEPVILQPGDSVQLLLLRESFGDQSQIIRALGRIAGSDGPTVEESFRAKTQPSVLREAFAGPTAIQALRAAGYFVAVLLSLTLVAITLSLLQAITGTSRSDEFRRRYISIANQFIADKGLEKDPISECVLRSYVMEQLGPSVAQLSRMVELERRLAEVRGVWPEEVVSELHQSAREEFSFLWKHLDAVVQKEGLDPVKAEGQFVQLVSEFCDHLRRLQVPLVFGLGEPIFEVRLASEQSKPIEFDWGKVSN